MENNISLGLAVLFGVAIGIAVGAAIFYDEDVTCTACPDVTCPELVIPECPNVSTSCPAVEKLSCMTESTAEEEAELYEEETGRRVFHMTSSRGCADFLDGSYLRPDKEVIFYADTDDGCELYYILN